MDWEGLNKLYQRYRPELLLYIFSLCRDWSLSEDILQDTFLKAYFSLPQQHGNVRAWLYLVARNQYFDYERRRKIQKSDQGISAATSPGPEEKLIKDESQRELLRAMGKLEERKREILTMQYFGLMSHKEIGAILNIRPDYVRVLGCRAKKELKKLMEEAEYELP